MSSRRRFRGRAGAAIFLEVVERPPPPRAERPLGIVTLGDTLVLERADGTVLTIVARRAVFHPAGERPLEDLRPLSEVVPLLGRASGVGAVGLREHVVRRGDRLRLRAVLEPVRIVRDDLGQVELHALAR